MCLCHGNNYTENAELLNSITAKDVRPYTNATLLKVLANPERYDNTTLTLIGFLNLDFNADGLYLHKDDYDYAIYGNALKLDASDKIYQQLKEFENQYVIITGKFKDRGSLFTGELIEIESCEPRPVREAIEPLHITLEPNMR